MQLRRVQEFPRRGGVGGHQARDPGLLTDLDQPGQIMGRQVRGQLHEDGHRIGWSQLARGVHQRTGELAQQVTGLQAAQLGGVGAGDIDRDIVGVRCDGPQREQVVLGGLVDRSHLGLADRHTDRTVQHVASALDTPLVEAGGQRLDASVVEAHPVDDGVAVRQPEDPGLAVAGLGVRGHGAQLCEREPERRPAARRGAVLVEAGRHTDAAREPDSGHLDRVAARTQQRLDTLDQRIGQLAQQRDHLRVNLLGITAGGGEQGRTHQPPVAGQ